MFPSQKNTPKIPRQDPATPVADDATPQPGSDEEVANAAAMTKVNMAEIKMDAWLSFPWASTPNLDD